MVGLDKHKVPTKYVGLIKDMYNNVVTSVRTSDGDTDDFPIKMRSQETYKEISLGVCFLLTPTLTP